jgi:hypothetical protein
MQAQATGFRRRFAMARRFELWGRAVARRAKTASGYAGPFCCPKKRRSGEALWAAVNQFSPADYNSPWILGKLSEFIRPAIDFGLVTPPVRPRHTQTRIRINQ